MDKSLNKMVYRIRGPVPSSNYISENSNVADLSLTGNFIYTIVKHPSSKPLTFHLDFATTHGHPFRFTVSTFFAGLPRLTGTSTLRIPYSCFSNPSDESWTVLAMDVRSIAKKFAPDAFSNDNISHLKGVKMCSFMTLFGVYTSDYALNTPTLCKAANLSVAPEVFKWLPKAPKNVGGVEGLSGGPESPWRKRGKKGEEVNGKDEEENEENRTSMSLRQERHPLSPLRELKDVPTLTSPPVPPRPKSRVVKGVPSIVANPLNSPPIPPRKVKPMKPSRIIGCGGEVKNLSWSNADRSLTFPCNNSIVTVKVPGTGDEGAGSEPVHDGEGDFSQSFISVTTPVSVIAVSPSSTLLAAASPKHLKIYHASSSRLLVNLPIFKSPPLTKLDEQGTSIPPPLPPVAISFSIDEALILLVHYDSQRRLCISIYSVKELLAELEKVAQSSNSDIHLPVRKVIPLVAKQTSDFPISACKFTPYEPTKLVSCGKENVRFWRIKSNHLPGCPAILNEFARNTTFNDLAFESSYGMLDDTSTPKIIFAATSLGTLLQISYHTRNVLCVLKLHSGPIKTLAVNEGYAVTGSDDNYLRLWPLDFSDFLLEAQHESPVSKISLSLDGLKLLVGTDSGTIGVLDVVTQSYATVVRSHTRGAVSCLSNDTTLGCHQFATVGEDQTIRVWNFKNGRQKYEFLSPHDAPTSLIYHPNEKLIACGFESGFVRIFDILTTSTKYELEQHTGAVKRLVYTKDGSHLYSAATDGHISIFDAANEYMPLKTVACDIPSECVKLCLSSNGMYLASTGPESRSITIYDSKTLVPIKKLTCRKGAGEQGESGVFKNIFFLSPNSTSLVAFTDTKAVYFYQNGKTCYDTLPGSGALVNCVAKSHEYFAVSCGDSQDLGNNMVYLWKCARAQEGGSAPIKETKRCTGHWGKLTCLDFSRDGKFLIGSDETGVIYAWDVVDGEDSKEVEALKFDNLEDAKTSIKALSNPNPLTSPPIPPRPAKKLQQQGNEASLTMEQVMSLVLKEMIVREWIDEHTAEAMGSPGFPENGLLRAAIEAYQTDDDFEELLDTFLFTSKQLKKKKAEGGDDEEGDDEEREEEERDEDEDEDEDEDKTEVAVAKYFSEDAPIELPMDAIVHTSDASPYSIQRAVGAHNNCLVWRQDKGMLVMSSKNLLIEEDLETNKQKFAQHELHSTITSIDISEIKGLVVTGSTKSKGSVRVWKRGEEEELLGFESVLALTVFDADGVDHVCFCGKDDEYIAVISGKAILLYDMASSSIAGNAITLERIDCLVKASDEVRLGSNGTSGEVLMLSGGPGGLLMWSKGTQGNLDFVMTSVKSAEITAACCSGPFIITGSSKGRVEMYGIKEDKVVETWLAGSDEICCIEGKRNGELVIVGVEDNVSQFKKKADDGKHGRNAEIIVEGGLIGMHWDGDGEEGVVATGCEGVKYCRFGVGGGEGLELIADYGGSGICTYSNDGLWLGVAIVEKGAVVVFNARDDELVEVGKVGFEGGREMRVTDLCFGEPESLQNGGVRLLIAISFSNFFLKVACVEIPGGEKRGEVQVKDCICNMQRGRGGDDMEGDLKVAFVDMNTHLATGGSDGELVLSPVEVGEDGEVKLKQETFDMLEHKKQEGKWAEEVDWKWSHFAVHPEDSNVWCCCKLRSGGADAQIYIFTNGGNSHTIGVSTLFENGPITITPSTFLARFSLANPGHIVCAMGQKEGGSVCCVFDVKEETPVLVSITQLEGILISKLEVGDGYIFAGSEDGGVFVLSEENCSPLQNIDIMEVKEKQEEEVVYDIAMNRNTGGLTVIGREGLFCFNVK